ncbi:uncharacterized protein N7515_006836 [Penicillium bovifimosum]|uniref:Tyrosine specific protein phosphatases domain-containing protein n=1 Tax=Penicillium bovifimosum TaxID=126998 RepID=A0A9W9GVF7_9EURO|nr:uncharacterized protein N7515_006836 [Penicillium bovifimosum]KAJ5130797.1 hypothetical protein N7515_006836 [Penicillium bovifimosum]
MIGLFETSEVAFLPMNSIFRFLRSFWKAKDKSDSKTPSPSDETNRPPWARELDGFYNFRDIGGYRVPGNKVVKSGIIFRSANMDHVTLAGIHALRDKLGACCVFDLRSSGDNGQPNPQIGSEQGITVHSVTAMDWEKSKKPVQEHFSLLASDLLASFMVIYQHLAVESAPAFREILTHIINKPGHPIIIHCELGKDRTGIFIAILLKLLGVTDGEIAEDYHRTEGLIDSLTAVKTEKYRRSPYLKQPLIAIEKHFLAPKDVMEAFLAHINDTYGGVCGYMRFIGLDAADINRIRQNLCLPLECTHQLNWR